MVFWLNLSHIVQIERILEIFFLYYYLRYCPAKKEGGQDWYQSIRLDFVHNRQYFFGTLKGILSCFQIKKTGFSVQGLKKVESFLMWSPLPKKQRRLKTLPYLYWQQYKEFGSPCFKRYCPAKKEGGQEGYHSIRLDLLHHCRYFQTHVKG